MTDTNTTKQRDKLTEYSLMACVQLMLAMNGSTAEVEKFMRGEDRDALLRKYGERAMCMLNAVRTLVAMTNIEAAMRRKRKRINIPYLLDRAARVWHSVRRSKATSNNTTKEREA